MDHSYVTEGLGPFALWGEQELVGHILPFWECYGRDPEHPGFYGELDNQRRGNPHISRSVVMTARHLWTYSAASRLFPQYRQRYLEMAAYAYQVLCQQYIDPVHGGVFWTVHPDGKPEVAKKQLYGQAFALYGLSEYALALLEASTEEAPSPEVSSSRPLEKTRGTPAFSPSLQGTLEVHGGTELPVVLQLAHRLFTLMETYGRDRTYGGYWEARSQDWSITDDMRLSPRDMNCQKSMNTNLHVLEAYTTYYRLLQHLRAHQQESEPKAELHQPTQEEKKLPQKEGTFSIKQVAESLRSLLEITAQHILGKEGHLILYFDESWHPLGGPIISYGHDIEASWLLWEAAETLASGGDLSKGTLQFYRDTAVRMAEVSLQEGFDSPEKPQGGLKEPPKGFSGKASSGALDNERHGNHRDHTRIWWCQAEALVGYVNAYQLSGNQAFLDAAYQVKNWISQFQIDPIDGEWFWAVSREGIPDLSQPKGGNWKASYHNGRCCMELIRRAKPAATL